MVSLHDVVAEMDLPDDAWTACLDRRTGELVTVTDEDRRLVEAADDPEDLPARRCEALSKVREALESDDFLPLPDTFEIHEYRIMERSCLEVEDGEVRAALLRAPRGRGAFRRFKEAARERGLIEAWFSRRDRAPRAIAARWLEAHGFTYTRENPAPDDEGA